jgi:hypothetical protein
MEYHWKITFTANTLHKGHKILQNPAFKNGIFAMDSNTITMYLITDEPFLPPLKKVRYEPLEESHRKILIFYILGLRPTREQTLWIAKNRSAIDHWTIQHFYIKGDPIFKSHIQEIYDNYKNKLPEIFEEDPNLIEYPAMVWLRNFARIY